MEKRSQIEVKENQQGLRISPRGDFDSMTALRLIDLLCHQFQEQGQVFIDTGHLGRVCPFGSSVFKGCLRDARLPLDRLNFTGDKARTIAPEGRKVLPAPHGEGTCAAAKEASAKSRPVH